MRSFITAFSITLMSGSPYIEGPPRPSPVMVGAAQEFIFMSSPAAFSGDRGGVRDAIMQLGPDFDTLYIETRGPLGDLKVEILPGVETTVREYFDRVVEFANVPDVA